MGSVVDKKTIKRTFIAMWWSTLLILASAAVHNQTKTVKSTPPKSDEWEVVSGCMRLIQVVLPSMSAGFGGGLLTFFFSFWCFRRHSYDRRLGDGAVLYIRAAGYVD